MNQSVSIRLQNLSHRFSEQELTESVTADQTKVFPLILVLSTMHQSHSDNEMTKNELITFCQFTFSN